MSCLHHANCSLLLHSLDPAREESELEAQAKEANTDPEQSKPSASHYNPYFI
jgi:hypothetical protein